MKSGSKRGLRNTLLNSPLAGIRVHKYSCDEEQACSASIVRNRGFTIVEVLIFLAVSGGLMLSAFTLLSGSQGKAQFNQSINDMQQQLTTTINNVANGYYPAINATCTPSGYDGVLQFNGSAAVQGTNKNCVFLGKILKFAADEDTFKVYSIAGAREYQGVPVQTMREAQATVMPNPESIPLKGGIKIVTMKRGTVNIGAVGFFTSFGEVNTSGANALRTGSLKADFIDVMNTDLTGDLVGAIVSTSGSSGFRGTYDTKKNPVDGVTLCFESSNSKQHGTIVIGGANKSATTTVTMGEGACV